MMNLSFRQATPDDIPRLAQWLSKPHVKRRWPGDSSPEGVAKKYGPALQGASPTTLFIVAAGAVAIGMVQSYLVDDYPDHAASVGLPGAVGIDLLIGEEAYVGKGYGSALLRLLVQTIVPARYPAATQAVADPAVDNLASIRAFEKAGFQRGAVVAGEHGPEQLMIANIYHGSKAG